MNEKEIINSLTDASEILTKVKDSLEELDENGVVFNYETSIDLVDITDLVYRLANSIDRIVYQGK